MKTEILFHEVEYWYNYEPEMELQETDREHIIYMINEGNSSGELNYLDSETDEEFSGWWQIKGFETN